MRKIVSQGLVDIVLMSVSTSEQLTINERIFGVSGVKLAIRATDIWLGLSGTYTEQLSLPFRSTTIDHAQCGKWHCEPDARS